MKSAIVSNGPARNSGCRIANGPQDVVFEETRSKTAFITMRAALLERAPWILSLQVVFGGQRWKGFEWISSRIPFCTNVATIFQPLAGKNNAYHKQLPE